MIQVENQFKNISKSIFEINNKLTTGILTHYPKPSWKVYSNCYKDSAIELVESVKKDFFKKDRFIYSIIFLFRQCIELKMKCIILSYHNYTDEIFPKIINHDLKNLLNEVKGILNELEIEFGEVEQQFIDRIEEMIKLDQNSFNFRYPYTKKNEPSINNKLKSIDLNQFCLVMESLTNYLDSIIDLIDDLNSSMPSVF